MDCKDMEKSRLEVFEHLLSTNPSLTWTHLQIYLLR